MGQHDRKRGKIHVRIALPNGGSVDEADVALIEAIEACGSILGTSRHIAVSYRKTWLMVDALNRTFDTKVIETFPGRAAGAKVTDFGHRLVALFRSVERRSSSAAAGAIDELVASLDWKFEQELAGGARAAGRG